ncbi:hypothetical protein [Microscilla marina]|uniref:Uncharacterized protein n=1 Tax=Microscilla marina ATCC 23134 TaxID=313606 RepID=A2A0H2_MICM2|nr:hypothetical protein [Microscilla marina]EAY23871.1 hypothetical protein M23134_01285 [Microscilla marina ATCC 23134]
MIWDSHFVYEYHYKDHLGNLRVAFREGEKKIYRADFDYFSVHQQAGIDYDEVVRVPHPMGNGYAAKHCIAGPLENPEGK